MLEIKHSHLSSAKVKNEWSCVSTSPCASVAWTGTALPVHDVIFLYTISLSVAAV